MWDPGGLEKVSYKPNETTRTKIISAMVAATNDNTHANMVVVGKHCHIIRETGRSADVNPFTPEYEALRKIPVVDAAILYEDPVSGKEHLLVVRNALYVEAMENNLVPPFIMREAGLTVNDVPKIQLNDPSVEDHTNDGTGRGV